jgi:chromosomal replication initiation ATPase DnaA
MLPQIKIISEIVAKQFGYTVKDLISKSRNGKLVYARHTAIYLIQELTHYDKVIIAESYNIHRSNLNYIKRKMENYKSFYKTVDQDLQQLASNCRRQIS